MSLKFAGYAALFDKRDDGRDVIRKGAFERTLDERQEPLPLFWQHRPDMRIGWVERIAEDERGLRVIASIDNPQGGAAAALQQGKTNGLSFGYRARGYLRDAAGRELTDIDLYEVSLVSHPMQHAARVHMVEQAEERKYNGRHYPENGQFARDGEGVLYGGATARRGPAPRSPQSRPATANSRGANSNRQEPIREHDFRRQQSHDTTTSRESLNAAANPELRPASLASEPTNSGGRKVSRIQRYMHDPEGLRPLPRRVENVAERSLRYDAFDLALQSPGSTYRSSFFYAAAKVTGPRGLTVAQAMSSMANSVGLEEYAIYDPTTLRNLRRLGADLYEHVNVPLFRALYHGRSNFRLEGSETIGRLAQRGTLQLDYAIVHHEQSFVQRFLDRLPASERRAVIDQSNKVLRNTRLTTGAIENAVRNLGHRFDFASQSDREMIGRAALRR